LRTNAGYMTISRIVVIRPKPDTKCTNFQTNLPARQITKPVNSVMAKQMFLEYQRPIK